MANIRPVKNRTVVDFEEASSKNFNERDKTTRVNMEYGELIDYNPSNGRVRVARLDGKEVAGKENAAGLKKELWFPLITPQNVISKLHSGIKCRKSDNKRKSRGLLVRYHWIGTGDEVVSLVGVEILGDFPLKNKKKRGFFAQERIADPGTGVDHSQLGK